MIRQYQIILADIYQDEALVNSIHKAIMEYSIDSKKGKEYKPFFEDMRSRKLELGGR